MNFWEFLNKNMAEISCFGTIVFCILCFMVIVVFAPEVASQLIGEFFN